MYFTKLTQLKRNQLKIHVELKLRIKLEVVQLKITSVNVEEGTLEKWFN